MSCSKISQPINGKTDLGQDSMAPHNDYNPAKECWEEWGKSGEWAVSEEKSAQGNIWF